MSGQTPVVATGPDAAEVRVKPGADEEARGDEVTPAVSTPEEAAAELVGQLRERGITKARQLELITALYRQLGDAENRAQAAAEELSEAESSSDEAADAVAELERRDKANAEDVQLEAMTVFGQLSRMLDGAPEAAEITYDDDEGRTNMFFYKGIKLVFSPADENLMMSSEKHGLQEVVVELESDEGLSELEPWCTVFAIILFTLRPDLRSRMTRYAQRTLFGGQASPLGA